MGYWYNGYYAKVAIISSVIAMKYGRGNPIPDDAPRYIQRECKHHGQTKFALYTRSRPAGRAKGYRCVRCNAENKERHRKRIRQALIEELGGKCVRCGYARYMGALHFHHTDSASKEFEISKLSTSLERARSEVTKCVLLCANCHAETHAGMM